MPAPVTRPSPASLVAQPDQAEFFEYSKAANPIGAGLIPRIPYKLFPASLYDSGPSRLVTLDLSQELQCAGPATGPGLCANFIRLNADDHLDLSPNATVSHKRPTFITRISTS